MARKSKYSDEQARLILEEVENLRIHSSRVPMKSVHVFTAVDMRYGIDGLVAYAKSKGVKLKELEEETACIFISRDRRRMKAYSYNNVVSYMKAEDKQRPFDLNAVDEFPRAFDKSGTMSYAKALRTQLMKVMAKKGFLEEALLGE